MKLIPTLLVSLTLAWTGSAAMAQGSFPEGRPITMIVPFAAGSGTDAVARVVGAGLDAVDIPNMPMASPADLLTDAQHQATGFIRKVQHPSEGEMLAIGAPTRWSDTPLPEAPCPAPQLGQDTKAVLAELGYAREDIDQLLRSGAAATPAGHAAKPEKEPT